MYRGTGSERIDRGTMCKDLTAEGSGEAQFQWFHRSEKEKYDRLKEEMDAQLKESDMKLKESDMKLKEKNQEVQRLQEEIARLKALSAQL